jgi:hypothetical protein
LTTTLLPLPGCSERIGASGKIMPEEKIAAIFLKQEQ